MRTFILSATSALADLNHNSNLKTALCTPAASRERISELEKKNCRDFIYV